jgi:hypothetical protein
MKHNFLLSLALAILPLSAAADQHDSNGNLWLNYVGDHPLFGSPWGLHLEVQNRRAELGDEWQQLLIRPGINYTLSPTITVSAGWAYVKTYPYGDFPTAHEFPENRAWEQVVYSQKAFNLEFQHRLRLEQRWIGELQRQGGGDYSLQNWRYENRIRYMLRTNVPLSADKKTYLALWDEVFFNFGNNVSHNYFDQNRAFVGIGRKLTDTTRIEVGFMEQTVKRRGGTIWEHNHTASVWIMSKWPFAPRGS